MTGRNASAPIGKPFRASSSVVADLGDPDFTDAFARGDSEYVVLRYRTQRVKGDGITTRDETTPLVFVDGNLVGWGESAIEHAISDR